jgi:hypothetical protein
MVYGGALVRRADQRSRATAFRSACRRPINMGAGMSGPAPFIETTSGLVTESRLCRTLRGDTLGPRRPATRHDLAGVAWRRSKSTALSSRAEGVSSLQSGRWRDRPNGAKSCATGSYPGVAAAPLQTWAGGDGGGHAIGRAPWIVTRPAAPLACERLLGPQTLAVAFMAAVTHE